jgi:carbon-monoxide dehydrogenase medium subunit
MQAFDHFNPQTLDEAYTLLSRYNGRGKLIAGGTDLMLQLKSGGSAPEAIINLKRLPELQGLDYDQESGLQLGALTTLLQLTRSPLINQYYPVLAQAAGLMASEQIRSFATVGGNLCNASPSADLAPPLIALDGLALIVGPRGERQLSLEEFFQGPGQSALKPDELLKGIQLPPPQGQTVYLKQAPRAFMDIAVVGVAVRLQQENGRCRQARIVLAAVAPVPLRVPAAEAALQDHHLTEDRINQAAQLAAAACSPIDDVRSSAWYRRRMVEVLVRRGANRLNG